MIFHLHFVCCLDGTWRGINAPPKVAITLRRDEHMPFNIHQPGQFSTRSPNAWRWRTISPGSPSMWPRSRLVTAERDGYFQNSRNPLTRPTVMVAIVSWAMSNASHVFLVLTASESTACAAIIAHHGVRKHHSRAASPMFFPDNHSNVHVNAHAIAKSRPWVTLFGFDNRMLFIDCTSITMAIAAMGSPTAIANSIGLTANHADHVRTDCE